MLSVRVSGNCVNNQVLSKGAGLGFGYHMKQASSKAA